MIALAFAKQALNLLIAILRHPVGQLAAICLVFGGLGWWHGNVRFAEGVDAERGRWEASLQADALKARATEAKNAQAGQRVGNQVAQAQTEIRTVTRTIVREVPKYVTVEDDLRCPIPDGFVSVHDAAASARLPEFADPAARPNGASPGPAISDVAAVVAENYGACNAAIAQLRGWQDWWLAVSRRETF